MAKITQSKPHFSKFKVKELAGFSPKEAVAEIKKIKKQGKSVLNGMQVDPDNNLKLADLEFKFRTVILNTKLKGKQAMLSIIAMNMDNDSTGAEIDKSNVNDLGIYEANSVSKPVDPKAVAKEMDLTAKLLQNDKEALKIVEKRYQKLNS